MKILMTSTGSWGTGSFTVINALIHEFQQLGHTVKVFLPDNGMASIDSDYYYQNPDLYEIWKFPIAKNSTELSNFPLMIPDPHPRNPGGTTFKDLTSHQLELYLHDFKEKVSRVINEFQPDVIECQHIWSMAHIVHELGLPYIVTAHHSDQLGYKFDARMRPFADNAASNAKYIFTISDHVKDETIELYKTDPETTIVLPNGYDKTIFQKKEVAREQVLKLLKLDIPPEAEIVTFTGKLSLTKGVDIILEANHILDNSNIHFLLFGAGDINTIINNCKHKYSMDRVHIIPHQPAEILAQAHNIAKISIMPSRSEGFGIAGLEAMGCGLPIIVTKGTGPESFAVGESVEAENPKHLAETILSLINLPDNHYESLSKKALAAAQEYSWEEIAKERLRYYNNM